MIQHFLEFARVYGYPAVPLAEVGKLPTKPGIYYAVRGREVLYVGQAVNLRSRWSGNKHKQKARLMRLRNVRLHYRLTPRHMLDLIEAEEIELLKPAFNVQRPDPHKYLKGKAWLDRAVQSAARELSWMLAIGLLLAGAVVMVQPKGDQVQRPGGQIERSR